MRPCSPPNSQVPWRSAHRPAPPSPSAESNVAIGLARLGHRAAWAGLVGDDEPGRLVLRTLRGEGVDITRAATRATAPTGAMLREQRVADLVRVHYWRSGSAASLLTPADIEPALGDGARVLHLTGITCALGPGPLEAARAAAAHAHARGWTVALDVNHRQRLWTAEEAGTALRPLLPHVTVLIASDDELPVVSGAFSDSPDGEERAVDALLDSGVREVVVKRGEREPPTVTGRVSGTPYPLCVCPCATRWEAGDAFCAGYLSGLLDGLPCGRTARPREHARRVRGRLGRRLGGTAAPRRTRPAGRRAGHRDPLTRGRSRRPERRRGHRSANVLVLQWCRFAPRSPGPGSADTRVRFPAGRAGSPRGARAQRP